eukprot:4031053-Amphidinium_carterae.1
MSELQETADGVVSNGVEKGGKNRTKEDKQEQKRTKEDKKDKKEQQGNHPVYMPPGLLCLKNIFVFGCNRYRIRLFLLCAIAFK